MIGPRLGLGAWQLGGPVLSSDKNQGWPAIDDAEAVAILKAAQQIGIRFYDTAEAYGGGRSEELIGKAFGNDPDIEVCSKFGWEVTENGLERAFQADRLEASLNASLKRLKRDRIDHYLLHGPSVDELTPELIEALKKQQQAGKIGSIGLSANFIEPYQAFVDQFDSFELVYNEITQQNVPFIEEAKGKQVFIRSIFASGLLLKNADELQPDKFNDWRGGLPQALFDKVLEYKQQHPEESSEDLIRKALTKPVSKVIVGASSSKQVEQLGKLM